MANSDKNILITPNIGSSSADPKIEFKGADTSTGPSTITAVVYPTNNGTLSFDGSAGQLFSITNNLTSGSIFAVNDVSGIPSIDVNADGTISLGAYGGNIGVGTTNPTYKLHVIGDVRVSGVVTATTFVGTLTGTATSTTNIPNLTGAITSVGTATTLGSFSSANLATALTDETGSGSAVFATSPTLVTPALGTPSSGTLSGCTVDGTNLVGYKSIPAVGTKTASYTLVLGDVGKFVELGTGGTVVVPASVFSAGDAIMIFNNTSGSISCTCSAITTVYKGGTDADISTFSVTTRGVATFLFISATVAVVTGNLA